MALPGHRRCVALGVGALLLVGCGAPVVDCRNQATGYRATHRGPYAIGDCLGDPEMATGDRRIARVGPGRFTFRAGERFELTRGWLLEGAGPDRTQVVAAVANASPRGPFVSLVFVRGADVVLRGFSLDGDCTHSPAPDPRCREGVVSWFAIVVGCHYGRHRPPDCDVDGLRIEDVRVLATKYPFVATEFAANTPHFPGVFGNFLDFTWTIRGFQVASGEPAPGHGAVLHLGHKSRPDASPSVEGQGLGRGVSPRLDDRRRRYVVNIEDTTLRAHAAFEEPRVTRRGILGGPPGQGLKGTLLAVHPGDDDVELEVNLRRSTLIASQRVATVGSSISDDPDADDARVTFNCIDSALIADHSLWRDPRRPGSRCPPFDAAVYLDHAALARGAHRTRMNLVRCTVEVRGSDCPAPASVDTGALGPGESGSPRTELCIEESTLEPPVRGSGGVLRASPPAGCL